MAINYLGGKTKFAKDILSVILPGNEHRAYYEPFVGSAAFLVHVPGTMKRFANDKNPYMIAMHKAVRNGWIPPDSITEEEYEAIKKSPDKYPPELVGFVSVGCSFGATVWGSYARNAKGTNYAAQASRAVLDTKEALEGVEFSVGSFHELIIPDGSIVYCDPPYGNTTGYGPYTINVGVNFKDWCNGLVARDCQVFISGYPHNKIGGWDIVWERELNVQFASQRTSGSSWKNKRTECLFQHHSQSGMTQEVLAEDEPQQDMCPNCCSIDPEEFGAKCSESYHKWHDEAALTTERNAA